MAASPSYSGRLPGVLMVAVTVWLVLTMKIRTLVSPSHAVTSPRSMANGATAARMLPQFCCVDTSALSTHTWQNR
jgi:hypothetical protein